MNNILILTLGIANLVLVSYVTYIHFKISLKSQTFGQLILKVKTSILLLLILFEILIIMRYSLDFNGTDLYLAILTLHQFLGSIIFFQICYFYAKKAAHYIPDSKKILLVMRICLYFSLIIFVVFIVLQFLYLSNETVNDHQCKSFAFLGAGLFN